MLQSLVNIGEWKGRIAIFTNNRNHPLRAELPTDVASRVEEIILDFNDWSSGRQGKLGSCRFRFRAHEHLDVSGLEWVMYLDTDCIIRKPLEPLMEEVAATDGDLVSTNIKYFTMAKKKFFNGHLTGRYLEEGYKCSAIQGGIAFFKASMFTEMSRVWAEHDALPGRDGVPEKYVNDQSSQNLLWLRCHLGELPYKMPVISEKHVINPRGGHRKLLGDTVVDDMTIWHFWGEKKRDQIRAAELELERLAALRADPLAFSRLPGLLGTWHHDKPAENLHNHAWTFHNNGLVTVAPIHLFGYWQARGARIVVTWERGWGSEVFDFTEGSSTLRGNTSGTGHSFTLTRQKELAAAPEGLIGIWQHNKPADGISNQWEFKPDGTILVHGKFSGLVGDWSALEDGSVCVSWRGAPQRIERFRLPKGALKAAYGVSWNGAAFVLRPPSNREPIQNRIRQFRISNNPLAKKRYDDSDSSLNATSGLDEFIQEAVPAVGVLIETGTYKGVSTARFAELRPNLRIVSIDKQPHPEAQSLLQYRNVTLLQEDSLEAASEWDDESVDVVYLDSD
ncbi:MAG TPA: class I SAM-dependent methyltransferase, partial [Oculatellaceae cyanobacterium]